METVGIELPSPLLRAATLEGNNLLQEAARFLTPGLYREDKVSLELAAEMCQTPLAAFMDFSAKHGVPPLRYNNEYLEEENQSVDRLET